MGRPRARSSARHPLEAAACLALVILIVPSAVFFFGASPLRIVLGCSLLRRTSPAPIPPRIATTPPDFLLLYATLLVAQWVCSAVLRLLLQYHLSTSSSGGPPLVRLLLATSRASSSTICHHVFSRCGPQGSTPCVSQRRPNPQLGLCSSSHLLCE